MARSFLDLISAMNNWRFPFSALDRKATPLESSNQRRSVSTGPSLYFIRATGMGVGVSVANEVCRNLATSSIRQTSTSSSTMFSLKRPRSTTTREYWPSGEFLVTPRPFGGSMNSLISIASATEKGRSEKADSPALLSVVKEIANTRALTVRQRLFTVAATINQSPTLICAYKKRPLMSASAVLNPPVPPLKFEYCGNLLKRFTAPSEKKDLRSQGLLALKASPMAIRTLASQNH